MKSKTQKRQEAADRLRELIETYLLALESCSGTESATARAAYFRGQIAANKARLAHLESLNKQNT